MPKAAVQLGMDNYPSDAHTAPPSLMPEGQLNLRLGLGDSAKDYFIPRHGAIYAGTHLIVDFWGARHLDDLDHVESAMRRAVDIAGATLLHIHLHRFTPNFGVSGVAVLAESHISVHTWPERSFAAFDVFMCGDTEPHRAVEVLRDAFQPDRMEIGEHLRGRME